MSVQSDSDSDRDSLESIGAYDGDSKESPEDEKHIEEVRRAVSEWKARELKRNTEFEEQAKGLDPLRTYVANSAQLYYDLNSYLQTATNNEKNMNDSQYVKIVSAIGSPASLGTHLFIVLHHLLKRDLIELPFTVEPKMINTYAKNGERIDTDFPDEE